MGLPLDFLGVLWVVPKALFEPEDTGEDAGATAPGVAIDTTTGASSNDDDEKRSTPKLAFKGFTYDYDYVWTLHDSALVQPWHKCEEDDVKPTKPVKSKAAIDAGEELDEVDEEWLHDDGIESVDDVDALPPQDAAPESD